jgi:AcrR family transcriptional regulator
MGSNSKTSGTKSVSFIEEARRSQIVETAIKTIAQQGISQASLAEIARAAGCSKGVISYHFNGKDELIEEILSSLLREPADFIKERVSKEEKTLGKLRAYVEANFEFMKKHREGYVALVDLWGSRGTDRNENRFNAEAYEPSRHYLANILEAGRKAGEIRDLPTRGTASLIQATIDGIMLQWVFDPDAIDLESCTKEIVEMVSHHVMQRETHQGKEEQP